MTVEAAGTRSQGHYIHANGIDIHYVQAGAGEPLLLLNNAMVSTNPVWAQHPAAYGAHVSALARHFRVIAPDLRGSGRTVHPGGSIDYTLLSDDVLALINALELDRPAVCGFSDGGHIATIVGIREPAAVRAIVNHAGYDLFNPQAPSIAMTRQIFGGSPDAPEASARAIAGAAEHSPEMRAMFELMQADHDGAQGPGHWQRVIAQTFARITAFCGYTFDDLRSVAAPTLILVGDRDFCCSIEEGITACRAVQDGELAVLPGTGHLITPAAAQTAIEFVKRRLAA